MERSGLLSILCSMMALMLPASQPAAPQSSPQQGAFTVRDGSRLLRQMNDALVTRDARKFVACFDLERMSDGELFGQQVASFIAHTDSIRLHFNITEATVDGDKGGLTVDAEMEAEPRDGEGLPLHKQATLQFVAEHESAGWKFTDVQPRSFFSISAAEPPPTGKPGKPGKK